MQADFYKYSSPETYEPLANHFGISVDNYLSSMPLVGVEAVTIAQSGLAIQLAQREYIASTALFKGAYSDSRKVQSPPTPEVPKSTRTYRIPDEVSDFAHSRNIKPLVIVRVGDTLLRSMYRYNVTLNTRMPLCRYDAPFNKVKLESWLALAISPLNMIVPHRMEATLMDKIKHKF